MYVLYACTSAYTHACKQASMHARMHASAALSQGIRTRSTWCREKQLAVSQYMKTPLGMPPMMTAGTIATLSPRKKTFMLPCCCCIDCPVSPPSSSDANIDSPHATGSMYVGSTSDRSVNLHHMCLRE